MRLIDTHVHLEDPAFDADREQVIARARQAGVEAFLNAGSTVAANAAALALAPRVEGMALGIGLHPHEFPRQGLEAVEALPAQLCQESVVALGEIGLDFHQFPEYPAPDREAQLRAFRRQLWWAKVFELPPVVHVREAQAEALAELRAAGPWPWGGVLHCYSGEETHLAESLDLGFSLGIGGPVTYPRAGGLRAAVQQAPLDRLLLETDAPYLPPQSRRGQRNEPAAVAEVAAAVARVRGLAAEEVAERTSASAERLFKLSPEDPGQWLYELKGHLYVNLTNRCSANCAFCPRRVSRRLQQYELTLRREPKAAELLAAIGDARRYSEVVFCGFGEPLLRLPTLLAVARGVKAQGARVRVDTNGHADCLFGRDILPECRGVVDAWSVSLNSTDPAQYLELVRPATGPETLPAVQSFIRRAAAAGFEVTATAVELPAVDAGQVRRFAEQAGARYRGRTPQRLGEPEEPAGR
ncbi:MAG: TatD family hydrolase [candidate division FCPU426 bacterium]